MSLAFGAKTKIPYLENVLRSSSIPDPHLFLLFYSVLQPFGFHWFFSLKEKELNLGSPQEEKKLKESSHPCLDSKPSTYKTIRTSSMLKVMVF